MDKPVDVDEHFDHLIGGSEVLLGRLPLSSCIGSLFARQGRHLAYFRKLPERLLLGAEQHPSRAAGCQTHARVLGARCRHQPARYASNDKELGASCVTEKYSIGPLLLDADAQTLTQSGRPVALGQRAIGVLTTLVRAAGEYVPKNRIIEGAWPGLVVEESNLSVQISAIRRALSQAPGGDAWVETLARRGYRFRGPVSRLPEKTVSNTSASSSRTNLLEPLTSFVGRQTELADIRNLLAGHRLVTLAGAGGIGKTRLAVRLANELLDEYSDGVWVVKLESLSHPSLVPETVARVLELQDGSGKSPTRTVCEYLESKHLLLVVDNAEHLIAACANFAQHVTEQCPRVSILTTSRERLAVPGEAIYQVPPLSIPPLRPVTADRLAPYDSVQLFRQRAQLLLPQFAITDRNAPALAAICQRLDGIPLALELAAARIRSMTLEEVNRRIDQRFRLLAGASRTAPRRQQTLRATIDWSYDILSDAEKVVFDRLCVFSGGWTLESAEDVCSGDGVEAVEMLDLLTALTDKNLVVAHEHDRATRYSLLETMREYAWERLTERGNCEQWQARHLACFLKLAEEAESKLRGADQHAWLDRLHAEHDNVRYALRWSLTTHDATADGLRLAASFWPFWLMRGHFREGRSWLSALLAAAPLEQALPARARAIRGSGVMAELEGDYRDASDLYEKSIDICRKLDDRRGIAASLNNLGSVASAQGDDETARVLWEQTLEIRREMDDELGVADVLGNLGKIAYHRGDYPSARAMWEESLGISRGLDDQRGVMFSLSNLGRVALDQADYASARTSWEASRTMAQALGDRWGFAWSQMNLGDLACAQNDHAEAQTLYRESLAIRRELNNRPTIADSLERLAHIAILLGQHVRAARIWGAVERMREDIRVPLSTDERVQYERLVAAARDALHDDKAFSCAWEGGRAMRLEEVVSFALE